MKRLLIALAVAAGICGTISAQPKAIGGRIGGTGFDVSYEHLVRSADFIEVNAGVDFGYMGNGNPGFKATGIYNFTYARPAWTNKGEWGLYAGPGLSLGYVNDRVTYKEGGYRIHTIDNGFMLSLVAQAGIEYTFWFPLQLSIDIRPMFGLHINDGIYYNAGNGISKERYGSKAGYYDCGWLGFAPTLSVRYRF